MSLFHGQARSDSTPTNLFLFPFRDIGSSFTSSQRLIIKSWVIFHTTGSVMQVFLKSLCICMQVYILFSPFTWYSLFSQLLAGHESLRLDSQIFIHTTVYWPETNILSIKLFLPLPLYYSSCFEWVSGHLSHYPGSIPSLVPPGHGSCFT